MKKIIAILLAALLVCFAAFAEPAAEALVSMEGTVLEIAEDGSYLINTEEHGEVQVLISEETYIEASRDIAVGDYLYIDYSGQMTRSIPPQITASVVRMHVLEGSVIELFAEENAAMLMTETHGEVYVTLPEYWNAAEIEVEVLTVYFDGVMTMSLPPQVNAGHVVPGYALQGAVTEIGDGFLMIGEGTEAVQVNFDNSLLPENMQTGDVIRVIYNGQMTRSIPAQITADQIIQISR